MEYNGLSILPSHLNMIHLLKIEPSFRLILLHRKIWEINLNAGTFFISKVQKISVVLIQKKKKKRFETLKVTVKKNFSPVHSGKELMLGLGDFKHAAVFPYGKNTCRQKICTKKSVWKF